MTAVLHVMGCRLNAAEGARIRGALEAAGWEVRESGAPPAGADAFVLHTNDLRYLRQFA